MSVMSETPSLLTSAGQGVSAAVGDRVGPSGVLDSRAEAVAVTVTGWDGPCRQILGGVVPVRAVVGRVGDAIAVVVGADVAEYAGDLGDVSDVDCVVEE